MRKDYWLRKLMGTWALSVCKRKGVPRIPWVLRGITEHIYCCGVVQPGLL